VSGSKNNKIAYRISAQKAKGKRPTVKYKRKCEDNLEVSLREVGD
jgi:hypothetical protein